MMYLPMCRCKGTKILLMNTLFKLEWYFFQACFQYLACFLPCIHFRKSWRFNFSQNSPLTHTLRISCLILEICRCNLQKTDLEWWMGWYCLLREYNALETDETNLLMDEWRRYFHFVLKESPQWMNGIGLACWLLSFRVQSDKAVLSIGLPNTFSTNALISIL